MATAESTIYVKPDGTTVAILIAISLATMAHVMASYTMLVNIRTLESQVDAMRSACPHCRPILPLHPRRPTGEIGVIGEPPPEQAK